MDAASAYLAIKDRSFLSLLPPDRVEALLKSALLTEYDAGSKIEQPHPGSQVSIVVSGEVSLLAPGSDSPAGTIRIGRSIELRSFLRAKPWEYAWLAEKDATLLSFDRAHWDSATAGDPVLTNYLKKISSYRELQRLKNDMRLFGFAPAEIRLTIHGLELRSATTFATGDSDGRYVMLISRGTIKTVALLDDDEERVVGEFNPGDYVLVDRTRKVRFDCSQDLRLWILREREWKEKVSPSSISRFLGLIDPLGERLASLEAAPEPVPETVPDEESDDGLTVADFQVTPQELKKLRSRKPVTVRQHDQMDCGAACMATIAKFYGRKISLPTYRALIHVTRDGASMLSIKRAAEKTGMKCIGVTSGLKGLRTFCTPFIALMQYHFVVVFDLGEKEVLMSDPARGLVREPFEKFQKEWSQNVLVMRPTEKFFQFPESPMSFRKYGLLLKGHWRSLVEVLLASVVAFVLGLASPLFMQFIFDNILVDNKKSSLNLLAIGVLAIYALSGLLEWSRTRILTHLTTRIDTKFSALFVRYTMKLPLNFFAVRRVGDITTRMQEIEKVRDFMTSTSISMIIRFATAFLYIGILGLYSLKLLALFCAMLPVLIGFVIIMVPKLRENQRATFRALGKNQSLTFEQISSFSTLKSLNASIAARWRWEATILETLNLKQGLERLIGMTNGVAEFAREAIGLVVLLYAAKLYMSREMTLGQVVAANTLMASIVGPIIALISHWNQFNQVGVSLARIDDIFTSATEGDPPSSGKLAPLKGGIEFSNVSFQYGSELSPIVLDGVTLNIKPGETVAFVGRSGSGKTTLGYMINLLYAPTKGKILVDGHDTRTLPLSYLRNQIAMIVQENALFSGTIIDNITMGDPHPSFKRAVDAAKAADAHGFISNLPGGYSTTLGESGEGLSGGQKQRINIARALYRDPPILIMDEATSALDAVSEQVIMGKIRSAANRRTTIIIAHRLNTIMHADRIVVLNAGRIVEAGTHRELLERQGHYYGLFRKQLNF